MKPCHCRVGSCPLHPVQCALGVAWKPGNLIFFDRSVLGSPCNLSHSATETDGIRRNRRSGLERTAFRCAVVKSDPSAPAFSEFECPQVNPGAPAHFLVHGETGLAAKVAHCVMCCLTAVRQCGIGYVHGIFAPFRNVGSPDCRRIASLLPHAFGSAGCAHPERIVIAGVEFLPVREPCSCICPFPAFTEISGKPQSRCAGPFESRVIVTDDLILLDIPFPRTDHVCARILEHRNEEGEYETLGEHVLDGSEYRGSLPFPSPRLLLEVAPVTVPEGYISVRQASAEFL